MDIPGIIVLSIPIVAIVMTGLVKIVRMVIAHRERMAMLEMGMYAGVDGSQPVDETERVGTSRSSAGKGEHLQ